jgi:hypothetical protein
MRDATWVLLERLVSKRALYAQRCAVQRYSIVRASAQAVSLGHNSRGDRLDNKPEFHAGLGQAL